MGCLVLTDALLGLGDIGHEHFKGFGSAILGQVRPRPRPLSLLSSPSLGRAHARTRALASHRPPPRLPSRLALPLPPFPPLPSALSSFIHSTLSRRPFSARHVTPQIVR
eukprot:1130452-Rhodomonas_salina.1